jgi:hypothetical protein
MVLILMSFPLSFIQLDSAPVLYISCLPQIKYLFSLWLSSWPPLWSSGKSSWLQNEKKTPWSETASELYLTERPPRVGEVIAKFCG